MSDSQDSSPLPPPSQPSPAPESSPASPPPSQPSPSPPAGNQYMSRGAWAQKHGAAPPVPTPPIGDSFVVFRDEPGPYERTAYRVANEEEAQAFSVIATRLLSDDFRHADEENNFSAVYYEMYGDEWADMFGDVVEIKDRAALHRRLFPALFELGEAVARLAVN